MMKSSVIKFFIGIFLIILAGVAGYHLFPDASSSGKQNNDSRKATKIESPVKPPVRAISRTPDETSSPEPDPISPTSEEEEAETPGPLRYKSFKSQDAAGDMQACLEFNEGFDAERESAIKPFIRVTPKVPFSINASAASICVLGLDYGKTYEIEVLKGLTADNKSELTRNQKVTVTFEDKPAFVGFAGDGIILPETKGARLVLKTVNVDTLSLKLYRVNDRILSQHSPDSGDGGTANDYVRTYDASGRRTEVWSGRVDVEPNRNEIVETAFDLQDKIGEQGQGAFVLIAENIVEGEPEYRRAKAIRWLISTDLALTSYHGTDALYLSVRSIKNATLKAGVRLDLIAENNEKLFEVLTDSEGRAIIDRALLSGSGPLKPKMVMAYGADGDYAVLDLSRAPLDLSMMDVQGRNVPEGFDLYAFTDRGIYRPGETVHLTALLRDGNAVAIEGRVLTLVLRRPDGSKESKRKLTTENMGGYVEKIDLPSQAARGKWSLVIGVEGTDTNIIQNISVEDFVPQRLKLSLSPEAQPVLLPGETREITLDAQFYYGAPGSNLETEGELRLQRDPNPFPDFADYRFGDVTETFSETYVDVKTSMTDETGQAKAKLTLSGSQMDSSFPLRASFVGGASEPGGRFVRENIFIPVRGRPTYIGFKSLFGYRAERNKPAEISLVAMAATGGRTSSKLTWTLNREENNYRWYRHRSRWQYRNRTSDHFIDEGTVDISADSPAIWAKSLDWGRYRLDMKTADGETFSHRFGVGWSNWGTGDSDGPDRILVGATNLPDEPGGEMTLNLKSPYAGKGDIVIADHTVRAIRSIEIPEGASSVRIPYDPEWGHDIYAMVTLYTSLDDKKKQGVKRAVGLTHVALDRSSQTLDVKLDVPDRVTPRSTLGLPIDVTSTKKINTAWVTIAAVDEGILALTNFSSPDATAAFFAKKAFKLDIHDDYSRMLNPYQVDGPIRSGGDSIGGAGLSVVPTKTVALFEGAVSLKNGKANVTIELPDFNGELRLMATAWTMDAIGSVSQPMKVRDAVPANLALPRFLAPGDQAVATLALDNIDGPAGTYRTAINGSDLIKDTETVFDLSPGARDQAGLQVTAPDIGIYNLTTDISGPKNYKVSSNYPIEVRSPYRPITRRKIEVLEPGESYAVTESLLEGYSLAGADINLSVANLPGLDIAPYLASLMRYPYGCTEQTISKAMPMLYVEALGGFQNTPGSEVRKMVGEAIEKVAARQSRTGEFGLWRQGDGYLTPWLQLYVAEFLVEAERNDFDVSEQSLTSALDSVRTLSRMETNASLNLNYTKYSRRKDTEIRRAERAAYAHYVLALADQPDASGIRYVDKAFGNKLSDPISIAYLGAALARIGDNERASVNYKRAYAQLDVERTYNFYSSRNRNVAALLAVGGETLPDDIQEDILLELSELEPRRTSTQEKSYIVRAISNMGVSMKNASATATGVTLTDNGASFLGPKLKNTISIQNTGDEKAFLTIDFASLPIAPPEPLSEGFTIEKSIYSLTGETLSPDSLKKGDRAIIHIKANATFSTDTMVVLADLLPAGLEIETVLTPTDAGKAGRFTFLGDLTRFDMQEARDDRFIASARRRYWSRNKRDFSAAYIVRAVTTGTFTFPGAVVEDMYKPTRVSTSKHGTLTVAPSGDF